MSVICEKLNAAQRLFEEGILHSTRIKKDRDQRGKKTLKTQEQKLEKNISKKKKKVQKIQKTEKLLYTFHKHCCCVEYDH